MSVASLRRILIVGREFVCEFVGMNAQVCRPGMARTSRRVEANSPGMLVSRMLDGPKAGELIYLNWKGIKVAEADGSYLISSDDSEPFLKITVSE